VSTAGLPTRSALLGTECRGDLSTIVDFDRIGMTCPEHKASNVGRVKDVVDSERIGARARALGVRAIIIVIVGLIVGSSTTLLQLI
jgi:hypothetical protein